jgi:circadian clock protein KaiC
MAERPAISVADERCSTGIKGLDAVLDGGMPRDCFYLVQGDPGSGKTTLALQFLLEGKRCGERVFYVTLSETNAELEKVARSHGWSLDGIPMLELSAIESLLRPEGQTTVFHTSELELNSVTRLLLAETRKHEPKRVVFDSLSEFRLMAETPLRYRRQLLALKQEFTKREITVLLLDDKMDTGQLGSDPHVLSLAHGVIEMQQFSPDYGKSRRRMRVQKMRGVPFREGYHDYVIEKGGIKLFPRLVAAEHHSEFRREPVRSGVAELDDILGGGLDRGTTTLIMGRAGTGKSTLALQYALELAKQGERSMLYAFDETADIVLERAAKLGMHLHAYMHDGLITLQQVDPAEISPGEFAHRILQSVRSGCRLVVVDSLNGYLNAMPGEQFLTNQLHELSAYLNQQGILTVYVLAQHGLGSATEAPVDLSYLADTVVYLRFFEVTGEVKKALSVVKKRSGAHEPTIRELALEAGHGIRIGPPLREFRGVLTVVPEFQGTLRQMMMRSDGEP